MGFAGSMAAQSGGGKVTVLNPAIASKMAKRAPLSPRLSTLDGKTLYLVDINWGGLTRPTAFTKRCKPGSRRKSRP